jgi:hypothetical protein
LASGIRATVEGKRAVVPCRSGLNGQSPPNSASYCVPPPSGLLFCAPLNNAKQNRNRANLAVGKDAPRSRVMAFCRRHCRLFCGLHDAGASIVLARLCHVRRGWDFGNSRKTTHGVAPVSVGFTRNTGTAATMASKPRESTTQGQTVAWCEGHLGVKVVRQCD